MKKFFFILLPILLLGAFVPGQVLGCGNECKKESTVTSPEKENQSCCAVTTEQATDCCNPAGSSQQSDDEDCGGNCAGKCNGHCGCTAAHFAAITTELLDIFLFQPDFTHQGFPFPDFFLSKRSLDIWLPPDIRV